MARPPAVSASRTAGALGSDVKTHGRARMPVRIAQTRGSSPLSTTHPRSGHAGDDRLDLGELVDRVDALQPRWSAETFVTTETSLWVTPMPRSSMPAAGRLEDADLHAGGSSTARAPAGPE